MTLSVNPHSKPLFLPQNLSSLSHPPTHPYTYTQTMKQPLPPNSVPPPNNNNNNNKTSPPSPEEILSHYESQGLELREASLKAISHLQFLVFRSLASAQSNNKANRSSANAIRELDNLNTRLAILEMKLDSKSGFPQSIVISIASGAIVQTIGVVVPQIARI